jgi:hypothetical protein
MFFFLRRQYLAKYLSVGAPVYFVVKESTYNYTDQLAQQKLCGGRGCDADSLVTQIYLASKNKSRSYIAATPASWIDDYLDWFRISECCKTKLDEHGEFEFCPAFQPGALILLATFRIHILTVLLFLKLIRSFLGLQRMQQDLHRRGKPLA